VVELACAHSCAGGGEETRAHVTQVLCAWLGARAVGLLSRFAKTANDVVVARAEKVKSPIECMKMEDFPSTMAAELVSGGDYADVKLEGVDNEREAVVACLEKEMGELEREVAFRARCNTWPKRQQQFAEAKNEVKCDPVDENSSSSCSGASSSPASESTAQCYHSPPSRLQNFGMSLQNPARERTLSGDDCTYSPSSSLGSGPLPLVNEEDSTAGDANGEEVNAENAVCDGHSLFSSSSLGRPKTSSRRNPWGNLSYADLITQAIQSAPERRLTLAQIYEWLIKNVPYFSSRGDTVSSVGWKVSTSIGNLSYDKGANCNDFSHTLGQREL